MKTLISLPYWKRCLGACVATMVAGLAQAAPQSIQLWHALSPDHRAVLEDLVGRYNQSQENVRVELGVAPTFAALETGLDQAVREKAAPHLVQLPEQHSADAVLKQHKLEPLYGLLQKYPVRDLKWFLPQTTQFVRDGQGRALALPLMAEIPVLFYNQDLFRKAGLDPNKPPQTWRDLQQQLIQLQAAGVSCPYATSRQVWVHQESLPAVNNQPFATRNNGLESGVPALSVDSLLHVRHLSLMSTWVRSRLLTQASDDNQPDTLFAMGECAVLTSGTGAWGQLQQAGFSTAVAPLPYYAEATQKPGAAPISGSSLWVVAGHPEAERKATADFLAWMMSPVVAAEWHVRTGFLPMTDAAARAADVTFYQKFPGAQAVVDSMRQAPGQFSRGFRLANYTSVRDILNHETTEALAGRKPPMQAQQDAVKRVAAVLGSGASGRVAQAGARR